MSCILCNCDLHQKNTDKYDIDYNTYCKHLGFCSKKCCKKIKQKELKRIEWATILNEYFNKRDDD
tara:strand:+ start:150 stop:344 length:195 start_codon:yes stop_codon:yes gene_type:complete